MDFAWFFAMQISDGFPVRVKTKSTAANFEPSQNRRRSLVQKPSTFDGLVGNQLMVT